MNRLWRAYGAQAYDIEMSAPSGNGVEGSI
jgi:hypothetical protein